MFSIISFQAVSGSATCSFKAAPPRLEVERLADLLNAGDGHAMRAQARNAGIKQPRQNVRRMADSAEQESLPVIRPSAADCDSTI
jgi:hypothetical protein